MYPRVVPDHRPTPDTKHVPKVFRLTTPERRGPAVRKVQEILRKAGYPCKLTSIFDVDTANACKDARWHIGMPESKIRRTFDDELRAYLTGDKKPSLQMRKLAKKRHGTHPPTGDPQPPPAPTPKPPPQPDPKPPKPRKRPDELAVEWMLRQVNLHGGTVYGECGPPAHWMHDDCEAWCADTVTEAFVVGAGDSRIFKRHIFTSWAPAIDSYAVAGHGGMKVVPFAKARRGNIVTIHWDGAGATDHVAMVVAVNRTSKTIKIVNGNTGGGQFQVFSIPLSQVNNFIEYPDWPEHRAA